MDELRFVSSDGEYLYLEDRSGTKFKLLLDESVVAASRPVVATRVDIDGISPRDIQQQVRNGLTIAEIVASTGAPYDYVEKFAAPVLDELAHVISSAKTIRITIAGDRYNDSTQIEFGEVIENRLQTSGAVEVVWSAKRAEVGGWLVQCDFTLAGSPNTAVWHFEPRKLSLSPENETAVAISSQNSLTESALPKLRPVAAAVAVAPKFEPTQVAVPPQQVEEPAAPLQNITESLEDTAEFAGVIPFGRVGSSEVEAPSVATAAPFEEEGQNLAQTADLLEALRKKRTQRESDSVASVADIEEPVAPATRSIPISVEPVVSLENSDDAEVDEASITESRTGFTEEIEPVAPKPTANYKKGRPGIPSWDEIVFGNKSDEEGKE